MAELQSLGLQAPPSCTYQSRTTKRTYVDGQHVNIQPGRYVKSDTRRPKLRVPIFGHDDIISDQRPTAAPINLPQKCNSLPGPFLHYFTMFRAD